MPAFHNRSLLSGVLAGLAGLVREGAQTLDSIICKGFTERVFLTMLHRSRQFPKEVLGDIKCGRGFLLIKMAHT